MENIKLEGFMRHKYEFENISGYEAKIVYPKKTGKGITGVHFENLGKDKNGIIKLSFYGNDLSEVNQEKFKKVIRTIRITK